MSAERFWDWRDRYSTPLGVACVVMIRSVRKSGHYMPTAHVTDHRFLVRTTTSRSRVSDNG